MLPRAQGDRRPVTASRPDFRVRIGRAWLFRVAHNKALDYLRRYDVRFGEPLEGELPAQTEDSPLDAAEVAEQGLSHFEVTFMGRTGRTTERIDGVRPQDSYGKSFLVRQRAQ